MLQEHQAGLPPMDRMGDAGAGGDALQSRLRTLCMWLGMAAVNHLHTQLVISLSQTLFALYWCWKKGACSQICVKVTSGMATFYSEVSLASLYESIILVFDVQK